MSTDPTNDSKRRRIAPREAGLLSLSEIASRYGHDLRTLKRAIEQGTLRVRVTIGVRRYVHPDDYAAFAHGDSTAV